MKARIFLSLFLLAASLATAPLALAQEPTATPIPIDTPWWPTPPTETPTPRRTGTLGFWACGPSNEVAYQNLSQGVQVTVTGSSPGEKLLSPEWLEGDWVVISSPGLTGTFEVTVQIWAREAMEPTWYGGSQDPIALAWCPRPIAWPTATPTPTTTATPTATPTSTPADTPSPTATSSPTATPSPTATATATETPTSTATAAATEPVLPVAEKAAGNPLLVEWGPLCGASIYPLIGGICWLLWQRKQQK